MLPLFTLVSLLLFTSKNLQHVLADDVGSSNTLVTDSNDSGIVSSSKTEVGGVDDDADDHLVKRVDTNSELTIVGTWSSKSHQVFTGPGFYDPVEELLIEPSLPGISYSFSEDGWFEEAMYQVTGNPQEPGCPTAVMIFQHGRYTIYDNGTLILTPVSVDGRQLLSDPCNDKGISTYSRYSQEETFKSYLVVLDDYYGVYKLLLYQFNGAPMQPLYLAYRPPMMLPTETLNPTAAATSSTKTKATDSKSKRDSLSNLVKRSLENKYKTNAVKRPSKSFFMSDIFWYISVSVIGLGSLLFFIY